MQKNNRLIFGFILLLMGCMQASENENQVEPISFSCRYVYPNLLLASFTGGALLKAYFHQDDHVVSEHYVKISSAFGLCLVSNLLFQKYAASVGNHNQNQNAQRRNIIRNLQNFESRSSNSDELL